MDGDADWQQPTNLSVENGDQSYWTTAAAAKDEWAAKAKAAARVREGAKSQGMSADTRTASNGTGAASASAF